ncbi:MAG: KH domain-containing protein [Desulfonatronovibrio sp. MSAO_Bac4]|nr:MAG: KH domain-containing protein [Desulfonatronovibrio sp. MSAO_Bac4]
MEEYVEFTGKDVDDAIASACSHFNLDRDKLEIEIVSGGSSGIFGLVGVKKARVMAKKRTLINSEEADNNQQEKRKPKEKPRAAKKEHPFKDIPKPKTKETEADTRKKQHKDPVFQKKNDKPQAVQEKPVLENIENISEQKADTPEKDVIPSDPGLKNFIQELMVNLTSPLSPEAEITVNDQTKPIGVIIKDESTSELLIGRDGQTLSAIQYIANRIIAKNWPGAARIQVDTEDFLEKQNEKLQQNAQQLASKAKKVGKTMSTRPLSSYHRRIVHMALQNDKKVRTKSKGDGPMKRVLIMPRNRRRKPSQE